MPKFILRWTFHRNLRIARATKRDLQKAEYARNSIDGFIWREDADYLDVVITRLRARLDRYHALCNQPKYKEFH